MRDARWRNGVTRDMSAVNSRRGRRLAAVMAAGVRVCVAALLVLGAVATVVMMMIRWRRGVLLLLGGFVLPTAVDGVSRGR